MSKLIKNWTYLLFSDFSQIIINFFVFLILAVKLTPEGYGEFNVVLAIVAIFTVISSNLAANHVVTREITRHPDTSLDLIRNVGKIRFCSFVIAILAVFVYAYIKSESISVITFSLLLILANTVWDLSESIAFGYFVTKFTTIFNLVFSGLWLLIIFLLPNEYINTTLILILYSSIFILRGISYWGVVWRKFIKKTNNNVVGIGIKAIILMSLPYLWMRILGSFSEQIPILLLNAKSGSEQVGYFAVGFRFIIPITLAISTGLRAVFPFLTKLYFEDKNEFSRRLLDGFGFVLIWGTLVATVLVLGSHYWIPCFLGEAYLDSINTFNILAWFGVGMCFDLLLSTILSSTYKQNILAIITTVDFLILLPMLYYGTSYGAIGLAMAKLIGMLIALIYHIIVVNRVLKIDIHKMVFYFSCLFYVLMMCVTLLISELFIKIGCVLAILIIYMGVKRSPLRLNIHYVYNLIRNKSR